MKVGQRGRVTIPKEIRERFGIGPKTEVEFHVANGGVLLKKKARQLNFRKWKGYCRKSVRELGTGDEYLEAIRGR